MENSNSTFNGGSSGIASYTFMTETIQHVSTTEVGDTIEVVYKSTPNITFGTGLYNSELIFKIIYSWENGKMKKSDRIYGRLIPKQDEYYEFD